MAEYLKCFAPTWDEDTSAPEVRFVALDSETTGLDRTRDRLITIGAVAVVGDEILHRFEVMMPIAYNASAVTAHGITRDEARDGISEPEGLAPVQGVECLDNLLILFWRLLSLETCQRAAGGKSQWGKKQIRPTYASALLEDSRA